jgi:hypothetical protein
MKFHLKEIRPIMFKCPLGGGLNGKREGEFMYEHIYTESISTRE